MGIYTSTSNLSLWFGARTGGLSELLRALLGEALGRGSGCGGHPLQRLAPWSRQKFVWFNIGSVDTFERKLETAHWELGIELPE